jgi:hypothetical protein
MVEFMLKKHGTCMEHFENKCWTQQSTSFKFWRLRREEKAIVKNEGCDRRRQTKQLQAFRG